ncbi:pyrroloquinoline quinone biosynthesis peptide chaperone PqqD [Sedimentitalea nanhaiensis]|uniref:Pyrroloquinoline quinone biosynthesis protein D n=1 Tax=Sedimentitalea nanhaiensis TaxID=999627 RepID=A0A1I7E720_9RHOB|nr:pyrroloquinoline quinone biosynthesis peptide chaperone PqqD [Sedimentitalea nanhaiensis]SFU19613.1 pyrroloquinoline quinone biosynthesis protein D [Sedimentitalea nanhaiensis]
MKDRDIPVLPRGVRVHFDRVREKWVLLAPERAVTLDDVGHAILNEVDGTRSFGEITRMLAAKYDAPADQIAKDSAGFLGALRDRRFLDVTP